uniref:Putative thap domain protein n=1 Tax=Ixodes ricinus TaxID=34613 RepID=A0A0K8RD49_IXORI
MVRCCVAVCRKRSVRGGCGASFHKLPADRTRCREWIEALHLKASTVNLDTKRVCSDHFKPTDFVEGKKHRFLKRKAVPSVFLARSKTSPPNKTPSSVQQAPRRKEVERKECLRPRCTCAMRHPLTSPPHVRLQLPIISTVQNKCDMTPSPSHQPSGTPLLSEHALCAKTSHTDGVAGQTVLSSSHRPLGDGNEPTKDVDSPLYSTKEILFKCCFCTYVTKDQRMMTRHLFNYCNVQELKCLHCLEPFAKVEDLKRHVEIHEKEAFFASGSIPQNSELQTRTGEKIIQWRPCPVTFSCAQAHVGETPNTCQLTDTDNEPFVCFVIPRAYSRGCSCRVHMRARTGRGPPYKCERCQRLLARIETLDIHVGHTLSKDLSNDAREPLLQVGI